MSYVDHTPVRPSVRQSVASVTDCTICCIFMKFGMQLLYKINFCTCVIFVKICSGSAIKVKWSCYRPGMPQRAGRDIALLFHDHGTRWGWVVSSTPRPHFNPGKEAIPTLQEAGWAPGPIWTGGKSRPHRDSIPHHPSRSQSLNRLSAITPTTSISTDTIEPLL